MPPAADWASAYVRHANSLRARASHLALIALMTIVCGSGPSAHDVMVTNMWAMPITVQWSPDQATPVSDRIRLGIVAPGQTVTFRAAVPVSATRYVVHARYNQDELEFMTLCYDQVKLQQLNWHIVIPPQTGASSNC